MIDFTPLINALILVLGAIIAKWVKPWIEARTTNEQQAGIRATIRTLVFAAEQLYGVGNGEDKLKYVLDQLRGKGIYVDRFEIEAAVKENLNNYIMLPPLDPPGEES